MDLDELIDWARLPENADKYEKILHVVLRACDAQDYGVGVTTGEDDENRWIKITVSKT
jgi:hypothetical protein